MAHYTSGYKKGTGNGTAANKKNLLPTPSDEFSKPWLHPTPDWQGSDAEYAVEWALNSLQEPHIFQFLVGSLAVQLGGHRVDFFLPKRNMLIRVQGVYFHYQEGGRSDAFTVEYDEFQKLFLEQQGFAVIDIDSDDALADPVYFVKEAFSGIDLSRQARGIL